MKRQTLILTILIVAVFAVTNAAAQPYAITQSVIASGGGQNSTGTSAGGANVYRLDGTIGQAVAGEKTVNAPYAVIAGFFAPATFAPTAAGATLGGRVTSANGAGIRNVAVTLTDAGGAARTVYSGAGGYYSFTDVPTGATYIVSVFAKRYRFTNNSQIRSVTEDIADVNFVAENTVFAPLPEILTSPAN